MTLLRSLQSALLFAACVPLQAADLTLNETLQLPECHSIGWVNAWIKANPAAKGEGLAG